MNNGGKRYPYSSPKLRTNKVPFSTEIFLIVPFEAFNIDSIMPKPSPVPPVSLHVVKNGVNILSRFDFEIPVPLS